MDKLNKKQKFIILTVIGGIIILGTFIWSMIINLNQITVTNPIPEINLPELSEFNNNTPSDATNTKKLQEIAEILEQESGQNQNKDSQTDIDTKDIKLDLEPKQ